MKLAMSYDTRLPANKSAGEEGFEPSLPGPEPVVLPRGYSPATDARRRIRDVTELKSRRFSGVVNEILPLDLPQKAAGIGRLTAGAHLITCQVRSLIGGLTYEC